MASLDDVLKEVLERDFEKEYVEKVVNLAETSDEKEKKDTDREVQEDTGDAYAGPGDFVQNSVGRGAVESFIKNGIYEKYGIDGKAMKRFAKMTPTEMLSDFGKTVGELGKIRSEYQSGKMTAEGYKAAMSRTRDEIVGKMLEMLRKSILEDVFLRSVGIGPENRSIHSFKDLIDAFREEKDDPVDKESSPDIDTVEIEHNETDITPDAENSPDIENPDAELAEAEADAETEIDKPDTEELEQAQEKESETDRAEEQTENEENAENEDREGIEARGAGSGIDGK